MKIGVLALHGDVIEHIHATEAAAKNLCSNLFSNSQEFENKYSRIEIIEIRTKKDLRDLNALIIPGGESTTLSMLCEREGMFGDMKKIKNIFGTCAGAILLAKKVRHAIPGQKTLGLMDIEVDRNAYGRQTESFEKDIRTSFGNVHAIFIRAPKIIKTGRDVRILAKDGKETLACEERRENRFYMAATFHPELTSTIFHEYFLKQVLSQ